MSRSLVRSLPVALLVVLLASCGHAVREDRSIVFDESGERVAFQHGTNGVFVAGKDGAVKKIFQPGADVVATSAPLWSPTDGRLLFTTVVRLGNDPIKLPKGDDAAGNLYFPGAAVYTCWLRAEEKDGAAPEPVELFRAPCGHPGYVAANVAVRWHPDGQHVLFVKQTGAQAHGLFEFDLRTKVTRQVFPHTAEALLFDWSTDRTRLVCTLGSTQSRGANDGVWVGNPEANDWWQVPDSAQVPPPDGTSVLTTLCATRPVWAPDGSRFAFTTEREQGSRDKRVRELRLATPATRSVAKLHEDAQPLRDLRWAPSGDRLGFVAGAEEGPLYLVRPEEKAAPARRVEKIRAFVGWDESGASLGYVAADPIPLAAAAEWTFLLIPNPRVRDALWVAPAGDESPGRKVFSDMQVTFARWAPHEAKLSLWATFNPAYRSWSSFYLDQIALFAQLEKATGQAFFNPDSLRLRPGDPALLLDPRIGALDWKAVNTGEQTQIGHYYLLKREYETAWRWYEKAAPDAGRPEDALFRYHCLAKLGRQEEAAAQLARFEQAAVPAKAGAPGDAKADAGAAAAFLDKFTDPKTAPGKLIRDLHIAEVFLSLDAAEDGAAFFRAALDRAPDDPARLSKAIVLSQFLLLRGRHADYLDFAAETLLPLMFRQAALPAQTADADNDPLRHLPFFSGGQLAILPLCAPDYVAARDEQRVGTLVARLEALRLEADSDAKRLWLDLMLAAGHERLGHAEAKARAAKRVADNPARLDEQNGQDAARLIREVRQAPAQLEAFQRLFNSIR